MKSGERCTFKPQGILVVEHIYKLKMLPEGLKFVTTLKIHCVNSMTTTYLDSLQIKDDVEGEDYYKLGHVSSVRIRADWSPANKFLHFSWQMIAMKFMN